MPLSCFGELILNSSPARLYIFSVTFLSFLPSSFDLSLRYSVSTPTPSASMSASTATSGISTSLNSGRSSFSSMRGPKM